ncbi:MAG: dimethylarginine dimethylaminohydrolase family protein [Dehalococcoidia bacterium]
MPIHGGQNQALTTEESSDGLTNQQSIDHQWQDLDYLGRPDFKKAVTEYERFVALLGKFDMEINYLPGHPDTCLDSIYTHDPLIVTDKGVVLCNMGKDARRGEPDAAGTFLKQTGVPVLGQITGNGRLEGGDVVWIDERTVAVGQGYRSNAEGIRQLRALLGESVDEVITVPLPHWNGPKDVLHLMSFVNPIDHNLYLVYSRLMAVPFREGLLARGIKLLEVPDAEYDSMACNVLAAAPRKCIMLAGNPQTRRLLESQGVEVWTYEGEEISHKGRGGPTCLTQPILRA